MADLDDIKDGKDFRTDQPQQNIPFTLKGCGALDWGMQSRLSRIFNPKTGNTVMLAFDHGYFQGPTTGLERIDINIAPLFEPRQPGGCKLKTAPVRPVVAARPAEYVCSEDL
ncbi:hypothetical protein ACRWHA_23670, partial [Escherichia coli]